MMDVIKRRLFLVLVALAGFAAAISVSANF